MADFKDALNHLPWTARKHGSKDEYYVVDARDRSPLAHGLSKEVAELIAAAPAILENAGIHSVLASRRQIAVIWDTSDVQEVRPDLGDDQAWEVLQSVKHGHDANTGICWGVLKAAADALFLEPEDEEEG